MKRRGFTLLELLVALAVGVAVAAASMSALRTVVRTEHSASQANESPWLSAANRLLDRDLDQAMAVSVGRDFLSVETLSTLDPESPGYSPLSTTTYRAVDAPSGPWWVREEEPLASRTNARSVVTLLGPDREGLRLRVLGEGKDLSKVDLHEPTDRGEVRSTEGPFSAVFELRPEPDLEDAP